MAADASIFQNYLQQPRSVIDYQAQYDQADARRNALQQSALAVQKSQMDLSNAADVNNQRNALRAAVTSGQLDLSNPDHVTRALALAPDVAPAMLKVIQDSATSRAKAGLDTAQTGKAAADTADQVLKTRIAKSDQAIKDIAAFTSPQEALASLQAHEAAGDLDSQKAAMVRASIPQDPAQFPAWQLGMLKNIMAAKDQLALTVPDANAKLQAQTSTSNTASNNATSRANNAANIAKDYTIAGLKPDGTPSGNMDSMVDMLGQLRLNPTLALQRVPAAQRSNIIAQVQAKYPGWDETTYDAKKGAAQRFTYGAQGDALRSISTASAHLDQLGQLAEAMGNGNTQVINKVGNYFATQTGDPKVTNFDAIKNIVGQEVVKAIVAGGGSAGERDEAGATFKNASSPAQLKGAIQHYRAVMAAQQTNLLAQRRAAGLPDSTLPNYSAGGSPAAAPAAPVPPDIAAILAKHGGK